MKKYRDIQPIALVGVATTGILGLASLLIWLLDPGIISSLTENHLLTSEDTAAALVCLSAALLLLLFYPSRPAARAFTRILAAGVSIFGAVMLANYFASFENINIEQIFLFGRADFLDSMSPVTATGLFFCGFDCLLLSFASRDSKIAMNIVANTGCLIAALGVLATLAYIYGAPDLYGDSVRPVAFMTAVALMSYSVGLIASAGEYSWPYDVFAGSALVPRLMRVFLPLTIAFILVVSWFTTFFHGHMNVNSGLISAVSFISFSLMSVAIVALAVRWVNAEVSLAEHQRRRAEMALMESENRLRAVIDNAPEGIVMADREGKMILANPVAEYLYSRPVRIGESYDDRARRFQMLHISGMPYVPRNLPLTRSALDGEVFTNEEFIIQWPSGEQRHMLANSAPINDADGNITGAVGIFQDITERKRAEEETNRIASLSEALNRINEVISTTFDANVIMQRVIEMGARAIGAESALVTRRQDYSWEVRFTYNLSIPSGLLFSEEDLPNVATAAESQKPVVVNDAANDQSAARRLVEEHGIRSYLAVPLVFRGETTGFIYFNHHSDAVAFTGAEVDFASKLSSLASLVLENARHFRREHNISETLQEALAAAPGNFPEIEISHVYRSATEAARIGGDFYDVFEIDEKRVGIIMGDAAGKGVRASALVAVARNTIKAYAIQGDLPDQVMQKTNMVIQKSSDDSNFVTIFFAVLDTSTGDLVYCNGGHPPGIIKRAKGDIYQLESQSPLVGAFPDLEYLSGRESLGDGDSLVLYSDGVIEAQRNGSLFGIQRLRYLIQERDTVMPETPRHILSKLVDFTGGELTDDVAIMIISKIKPGAAAEISFDISSQDQSSTDIAIH